MKHQNIIDIGRINMCWTAINILDIIPKRAKTDIEVYKVVNCGKYAPLQSYIYSINEEEPKIKIKMNVILPVSISRGYHSFSNKCRIEKDLKDINIYSPHKGYECLFCVTRPLENIHKAIIPKGALYFINRAGEIVSNRIIVTSEIINIEDEKLC